MSDALDRLNEIVRQAEAKTRAQRIHGEIQETTSRLRGAVQRMREADAKVRCVRPVRLRELQEADVKEQQLKDLIKKVAQVKSSLEVVQSPEELIVAAHREIELKRREAREELDSIASTADEAKIELGAAMEQYRQLRVDLERLQPHLVAGLAEEDKLMREAVMFFPAGQLQALEKEVEEGEGRYGHLDPREQYAQLRAWIGRYRRLQTFELTEDEHAMSRRIFGKLVRLSRDYEPGYIEAFQINFNCDWDKFIEEAMEQLKLASQQSQRRSEANRASEAAS